MRACVAGSWSSSPLLAAVAGLVAPPASAEGTPIGNLGDTLRVEFKGIVADVTVHDVIPSRPSRRASGWNGSPRGVAQGGPWKAPITIHTIQAPNPYAMALAFTFTGVTPYADAYVSKHTDAPDALENALRNAPPGSTVDGAVYWDGLPRPRHERGSVQPADRSAPGAVEHLAAGSTATVEPWPLTSPRPSRPTFPNSPTSPHAPFRWPVPRR